MNEYSPLLLLSLLVQPQPELPGQVTKPLPVLLHILLVELYLALVPVLEHLENRKLYQ